MSIGIDNSTGYGPRHRLMFDGDEAKYELWEVKFLGYMRLKKLLEVISPGLDTPDAEKNTDAFAELVQFLDDRSLSLVIRDAKNDGRKALSTLREHYLGRGKPRIISLYTELTSLKKGTNESVTDYVIRAETAATSLKNVGETVSDSLLTAMVLKGLPSDFKTFSTVVTQRDAEMIFTDFKVALRNFEETEKCLQATAGTEKDCVMNTNPTNIHQKNLLCYSCGKPGHRAYECRNKKGKSRWCENCRSHTHDTKFCRKKDAAKSVNECTDASKSHCFAFKVNVNPKRGNSDGLLVDCGATAHIVTNKSNFIDFDETFNPDSHCIELADGSRTNGIVAGRGKASVTLYDRNDIPYKIILENALYVPSYQQDIFSVQAATERGAQVNFNSNSAELNTPDGTTFDIKKRNRLYFLNNTVTCTGNSHTVEEWHRILGHCNVRDVLKLESVVDDMKIQGTNNFDCETCITGKMVQYQNRMPDRRATESLELMYCDLAGPVTPASKDGFRYVLSFVDDYSGINMVYFLKSKADTIKATERFIADCAPCGVIKCIRSDNGGEFISDSFESLLAKNNIKHEKTAPYSPHQNGTVERAWRSIFEMGRCLLLDAKIPKELWTYAVMAAVYIRNRCFNPRIGKTPFEAFTGRKPSLSGMHIFGTVCYAYVQIKKKLDARSEKGIFVGYDKNSPAYLVYFPEKNDIRKVRCVKFLDRFDDVNEQSDPVYQYVEPVATVDEHVDTNENGGAHAHNVNQENMKVSETKDHRYPQRDCRPPSYLNDYVTDVDDSVLSTVDYLYHVTNVPCTYTQAIFSSESEKWKIAMNDEIDALIENETYEITKLPQNRSVVGGRWVYTVKLGPNDEEKHKARYVAKGYSQIPNIDYNETFSPTARITSIRTLMQIAVQNNMIVHQMDVKTAYLNAPIDCEIYIDQPEGYEVYGKNGEKLVCKLNKSLYGLKQSGRNWNNLLHVYLVSKGFSQSEADPCVYTMSEANSKTIVIIWVDDIIIATSDECTLQKVKKSLSQRFKMKDLGKLSWFLGIQFKCEDDVIELNQTKYLEKVLHKFKMQDCKPKSTPCDVDERNVNEGESEGLEDARLYREIVGSLIYCMTTTRPDLCYVVTKLSQAMSKPTMADLEKAKRVLRYIKGTLHYCLKFTKADELKLVGYADADWGGSSDRKSITGYGYMFNVNGPLVSYKSRKQRCVALSTCEAEYIALSEATQEAKFLHQLYNDMCCKSEAQTVLLFSDNQGAIALAKNPVHHQRSKHVDIRYHYVRQQVQEGHVELDYVPSENNLADVFTKPVTNVRLQKFVALRGM